MSELDNRDPDAAVVAPPTTIRGILSKLGPGLIIAGSIVGSGELIATTTTGATGGLVFIERGILLHSNSYNSKDSIKISDQFSITSSNKILKDINNSNSLKNYKLMLGHAGWISGQLEKEIENGDWLMQSTSIDFVFNTNESKMWQIAAKSFGVELSEISGFGGSA